MRAIDRVLGVGRETSECTKWESFAICGDAGGESKRGGCEAIGGSGATGGIAPGRGGWLAGAGTDGGTAAGAGSGARATCGELRAGADVVAADERNGGTGAAVDADDGADGAAADSV